MIGSWLNYRLSKAVTFHSKMRIELQTFKWKSYVILSGWTVVRSEGYNSQFQRMLYAIQLKPIRTGIR